MSNTASVHVRTTMTAINHHTVVHSVNAGRAESGNYLLRLTNDSGSDEGEPRTNSRFRQPMSSVPGFVMSFPCRSAGPGRVPACD